MLINYVHSEQILITYFRFIYQIYLYLLVDENKFYKKYIGNIKPITLQYMFTWCNNLLKEYVYVLSVNIYTTWIGSPGVTSKISNSADRLSPFLVHWTILWIFPSSATKYFIKLIISYHTPFILGRVGRENQKPFAMILT